MMAQTLTPARTTRGLSRNRHAPPRPPVTLSRKESRDNRKTEGNGDDPRTRLGIGMRRRGRDKMQHFATECNTLQGPTRTRHARNTYTALDGRAGVMHFAQLLINFGLRLIVVVANKFRACG